MERVRTYGSLAVLAIAAAAAATSCTLLVQFHDAANDGCEGGFCAGDATATGDGGSGGPDAGADSATGGIRGRPRRAVRRRLRNRRGGRPLRTLRQPRERLLLRDDGLHGYAGSTANLVQCDDGGIAKVTTCDGGCLPLPAPFPDACNPCPGHGDGLYCGRDLTGFPAINADFLIQCQSGNVVQSVACAHGCKSSGTASSCYP